MTDWAPEDFVEVTRETGGPLGQGSRFVFVTKGARTRSVFTWDVFDQPNELRFSGPRLSVGAGWVEGSGGYVFTRARRVDERRRIPIRA